MLGQQKLTELRDKIVCVADYIAVGEFSENPNQPPDTLAKVTITVCCHRVVVAPIMHCMSVYLPGQLLACASDQTSEWIVCVRIVSVCALRFYQTFRRVHWFPLCNL